jgi:hypothetical protein
MLTVYDCEQGSEDWFRARMGIPTASEFGTVLAPRAGSEGKMRRTYLHKLAGEIITGEPMERYGNAHMDRGHEMEAEARSLYAFMSDADPTQIGFLRNGQKGCSPDSLIGDAGMLEIKTKLPHLLIDCILKDDFPAEHKAQCQGALWVAEREWVDIAVYWPRMPLFVKRAYRDEEYISKLSDAIDAFNADLAAVVDRIKAYGVEPAREAA